MHKLKTHMATAAATQSRETLTVLNETDSTTMIEAFSNEVHAADLLLTYGPTNDEQALVRDKHRAAAARGQDTRHIDILKLPVFNMYQACMRLKQAHDCKYNPALLEQLRQADARQRAKQQFGLSAMHAHFVRSVPNQRRFVTPLPEGMHTDAVNSSQHVVILSKVLFMCRSSACPHQPQV